MMEKREMEPVSVPAIGLGAMRFAGARLFGHSANRDDAIAFPRAAILLSLDHIDMAQYHGLVVVSDPLREALCPYPPQMLFVSKVGAKRGKRVRGTSSLRDLHENLAAINLRRDRGAFQLVSQL